MSEVDLKLDHPTDAPAELAKGAPESWHAWWQRCQTDPRVPVTCALHLVALVNLAIAQPVFNLMSLEPMVLVVHRARPLEIVLIALCLSWILPAACALVLLGVGRWSRRLHTILLLVLVFVLFAALVLPGWKRTLSLQAGWLVALALLTAALGTWLYHKFTAMRLLVTYAAVGGVLFPLLLLLRPPTSLLVFPPDARPVSTAEVKNPAPVVMVVFDEFSMAALLNNQRQIDEEKFPHFASLAQEATWYRNATSMSGYTQFAVPALLTGRRPRDVPASFANHPENLFTLLANHYDLTVFEPYTTLCPNEVDPEVVQHTPARRLTKLSAELARIYAQFLLPRDMAPTILTGHAQAYNKWGQWGLQRQQKKTKGLIRYNWSKQRAEQFEHFLNTIRPAQRPVLHFAHLVLPHIEYEYLPSGRRHACRPDIVGNRWSSDPWHVAQQHQQYLLQVAYVDRLLGRLVARLKEAGLYDDCLLVIAADHGVTFRPGHHTRDAGLESAPDVMWIPLFIKAPRQSQGIASDRNVEIIDVLPTMVDLLEIRRPWKMDGISAADPQRPARPDKTFYRTTERKLQFDADFPEKNSTLSHQLQWFSRAGGHEALFRIGPNKDLVGQPTDRYFVTSRPRWRVTIEQPETFRSVTDQTNPWPCFLAGKVDERAVARGPLSLAVAVNGRVEAVTRTCKTQEFHNQWQALVPEEAIREGDNDVRVYIIRRFGEKVTLEATRRD